jgi:hypothetical protein
MATVVTRPPTNDIAEILKIRRAWADSKKVGSGFELSKFQNPKEVLGIIQQVEKVQDAAPSAAECEEIARQVFDTPDWRYLARALPRATWNERKRALKEHCKNVLRDAGELSQIKVAQTIFREGRWCTIQISPLEMIYDLVAEEGSSSADSEFTIKVHFPDIPVTIAGKRCQLSDVERYNVGKALEQLVDPLEVTSYDRHFWRSEDGGFDRQEHYFTLHYNPNREREAEAEAVRVEQEAARRAAAEHKALVDKEKSVFTMVYEALMTDSPEEVVKELATNVAHHPELCPYLRWPWVETSLPSATEEERVAILRSCAAQAATARKKEERERRQDEFNQAQLERERKINEDWEWARQQPDYLETVIELAFRRGGQKFRRGN